MDARPKTLTRDELLRTLTPAQLRLRIERGDIRRVRPGHFIHRDDWTNLFSEQRHRVEVIAAAADARGGDSVFSHVSAAVLWDLPLFRITPRRVHTVGPANDGMLQAHPSIAKHRGEVAAVDRAVRDGIPCTSLPRTVYDLLRTAPREAAIAIADAGVRLIAWNSSDRTFDEDAAARWLAGLTDRIDRAPGMRGNRQARELAGLADGRAESPGESVSRLYLVDVGFARPRIQVPFPGPHGEPWQIDFGLDDANAWGEFDGVGKYTDPHLLQGRTGAQELLREKRREDWIRGRSGRPVIRWGMPEIRSAATLAAALESLHVAPR